MKPDNLSLQLVAASCCEISISNLRPGMKCLQQATGVSYKRPRLNLHRQLWTARLHHITVRNFWGLPMASQPVLHTDRFIQRNTTQATPAETRRAGHGGLAWNRTFASDNMRQPQDGALDMRSRLSTINSKLKNDLFVEPEDARLTGGTRSLTRRLLGLNGLGSGKRKSPGSTSAIKGNAQVA
jgi:hypothetical protein